MASNEDPIKGRNALVTGAASGIGLAIARQLARSEVTVIMIDRDEKQLATASRQVAGCHALVLDITHSQAVDNLLNALPVDLRSIDILVNAAGHDPGGTTRFDQGSADDWESAINTNLLGTMRVTRTILPQMVKRDSGDIVNIGSIAALRIVPDMAAYTTSKAAVHAFSDALRAELQKSGVRVMEFLPGLTKTDLIRKRYDGDEKRANEYYERFGMALEPDDVAASVLHCLRAPARAVHAQVVLLPNNRA